MQKKVIIIGGGFAGLTAAAYLAKNNFKVTLLESSPKLGGRAYSFLNTETNTEIDNGQHILMGCYKNTLKFLSLIGASKNFYFQKRLEVNFVKQGFKLLPLKSAPLLYPLNLIFGLINFKAINIWDRLNLLKVFLKLPFYSKDKFSEINIMEWIKIENQTQDAQNAFWKILAIGALNTNLENASARIFIEILKQIFLNGNSSATIILPKSGLSESYCKNAEEFIKKNGGQINLSESVEKLIFNDSDVKSVETSKQIYYNFDFVVSTIPAFALERIIGKESKFIFPDFEYSSILNIHIWLKKNIIPEGFFGLIDSPMHWLFKKGSHLNIVISDANKLVNMSDEELMSTVKSEMQKFFMLDPELILNYKIIKEKRATFIPSNDVINKRPNQKTRIDNLILAGDWVDTSLPSTIESAVKSGRIAAELVMNIS